eukprot:GHVO01070699.1.p2 GENE.GHVO01070699.1~~GHVO01070699.1.p2  ORF type:complete len:105 (-),score=0.56 GHVO01070699.1:1-315(-)
MAKLYAICLCNLYKTVRCFVVLAARLLYHRAVKCLRTEQKTSSDVNISFFFASGIRLADDDNHDGPDGTGNPAAHLGAGLAGDAQQYHGATARAGGYCCARPFA